MALMLLPHWTDGCIGSMEGLFFEASATTPFHFLTQVELSAAPSAAQRDLPYGTFDIDAGVRHLQLMGVRYYLATSRAGHHRRARPPRPHRAGHVGAVGDLRGGGQRPGRAAGERAGRARRARRTTSTTGSAPSRDENDKCAGPAVAWYLDPDTQDVFLAASGPDEWQRVDLDGP